ncbi:MAG TPA: thioesterase domain-containing protein, partial [Anaerolineales bacterium]|nr:thioesterase domain-containing protein [Anaerolineales bacterium]
PRANMNTETRLFLFPYAGGGPAVFHHWPAEIPPHMEAWIAHYPGRGSRHHEPPIKQISTFAERLSQAVQPFLDRPFAFFGHSLGGLVAFELARHLHKNNFPQPSVLFVSACSAPHLPESYPHIHGLSDTEFLQSLQQLNGIPAELLRQPDVLEMFLPILRADFEAIESYVYRPDNFLLSCPIVAFGGADDPRLSRERLEAWSVHTSSSFRSRYFPGDHFFINTARESVIAALIAEVTSTHA